MNSLKYIGMDVHLASISRVVLDAAGKLVMAVTITTEGAARGKCIKTDVFATRGVNPGPTDNRGCRGRPANARDYE